MILTYSSGRFVVRSEYSEKEIPKAAGCRWSPEDKFWWTDKSEIARKLAAHADHAAKEALDKIDRKIEESKKADADVEIPCPEGLTYMGFQKAGISFSLRCLNESGGALIADEMGLGKTIQALGVVNSCPDIVNVLVICPASLRLNWAMEARKWLVRKMAVNVMTADWVKSVEGFNIINYDILARLDKTRIWDLVIIDEAHKLKNRKTQRCAQVMGQKEIAPKMSAGKVLKEGRPAVEPIIAKRKIMLTGTPIVNRPMELFSLISYLDPKRWNNFFWFAKRYCGGNQGAYGWDFSGATNLDELQDSLRSTLMVRRLKKDVLKELPAKRRTIVEIPANGCSDLVDREMREYDRIKGKIEKMETDMELARAGTDTEYAAAVERLKVAQTAAFTEIAKIRHETAMAKVPYVVEHALELLEEQQAIVIMAHHHDVVAGIKNGLLKKKIQSVILTGETKMESRQQAVDDFQAGKIPVFIGSIGAAGVGITLTKASIVLFAELDWVPGNVSQAEDRLHRIGQTDSVLVQHLVLKGSIDAIMAKRIVEKQSIIDQALDVLIRNEPILPLKENRQSGTRTELKKVADKLTQEEIAEIHANLKYMAGMDTDYAKTQNGVGFNKIDAQIGHSLAEAPMLTALQAALGKRILNKYKGQLNVYSKSVDLI